MKWFECSYNWDAVIKLILLIHFRFMQISVKLGLTSFFALFYLIKLAGSYLWSSCFNRLIIQQAKLRWVCYKSILFFINCICLHLGAIIIAMSTCWHVLNRWGITYQLPRNNRIWFCMHYFLSKVVTNANVNVIVKRRLNVYCFYYYSLYIILFLSLIAPPIEQSVLLQSASLCALICDVIFIPYLFI